MKTRYLGSFRQTCVSCSPSNAFCCIYRGCSQGSRRILGSNYGFADPPVDFPRYAALHLEGRLPVERLIDRRIGLDEIEPAFDRLRAGDGLRQVVVFD